jgi:hypothetical protein
MLVLHPSLDGMIIMPSHAGVPLGRAIFVCKITRYNFLRIRYSHCVPSPFDMCLIVECTEYGTHFLAYDTFHHDGKISPGALPPSFTLSTSRAKLWCTLQLRGQIHPPYFSSTPIRTLWLSACPVLRRPL